MDSKIWASLKGTDKLKSALRAAGLSPALAQVSYQSLNKTEKAKIEKATKGSGWHEDKEQVVTDKGIKNVAPRHREVAVKEALKDTLREPMVTESTKQKWVMYHGTGVDETEQIMRHGLSPQKQAIFLTSNMKTAETFASTKRGYRSADDITPRKGIILEVTITEDDFKKQLKQGTPKEIVRLRRENLEKAIDDGWFEYEWYRKIPPEQIKIITAVEEEKPPAPPKEEEGSRAPVQEPEDAKLPVPDDKLIQASRERITEKFKERQKATGSTGYIPLWITAQFYMQTRDEIFGSQYGHYKKAYNIIPSIISVIGINIHGEREEKSYWTKDGNKEGNYFAEGNHLYSVPEILSLYRKDFKVVEFISAAGTHFYDRQQHINDVEEAIRAGEKIPEKVLNEIPEAMEKAKATIKFQKENGFSNDDIVDAAFHISVIPTKPAIKYDPAWEKAEDERMNKEEENDWRRFGDPDADHAEELQDPVNRWSPDQMPNEQSPEEEEFSDLFAEAVMAGAINTDPAPGKLTDPVAIRNQWFAFYHKNPEATTKALQDRIDAIRKPAPAEKKAPAERPKRTPKPPAKKYFMTITKEIDGEMVNVRETVARAFPFTVEGIELFAHKELGDWRVTEASTGLKLVGEGKTKEIAIQNAEDFIRRTTPGRVKEVMQVAIKRLQAEGIREG